MVGTKTVLVTPLTQHHVVLNMSCISQPCRHLSTTVETAAVVNLSHIFILFFCFFFTRLVPAGSPSRGGDVTVYA